LFLYVFTAVVLLFIFLPVLAIVVFAFSETEGILTFPPIGFTLRHIYDLAENEVLINSLYTSLQVALVTVAISVPLGTIVGYVLTRFEIRVKKILEYLVYLPLIIPPIIVGISLLLFISGVLQLQTGFWSVVLGHVLYTLPFSSLIMAAALSRIDRSLEWAARDLGAGAVRAFASITLRLSLSGMVSAALLVFTLSFDEFVITYFIRGVGFQTFPIWMFDQLRRGTQFWDVTAAAAIIFIISMSLITASAAAQLATRRIRE